MNLNAILIFDAEKLLQDELKAKALKNQYKVNRANSLRQTKHNIVRLFQQLNPLQLWHKLIKAMALEKEPVRTGRKYPRTINIPGASPSASRNSLRERGIKVRTWLIDDHYATAHKSCLDL